MKEGVACRPAEFSVLWRNLFVPYATLPWKIDSTRPWSPRIGYQQRDVYFLTYELYRDWSWNESSMRHDPPRFSPEFSAARAFFWIRWKIFTAKTWITRKRLLLQRLDTIFSPSDGGELKNRGLFLRGCKRRRRRGNRRVVAEERGGIKHLAWRDFKSLQHRSLPFTGTTRIKICLL